jgi:hypothetical protein
LEYSHRALASSYGVWVLTTSLRSLMACLLTILAGIRSEARVQRTRAYGTYWCYYNLKEEGETDGPVSS